MTPATPHKPGKTLPSSLDEADAQWAHKLLPLDEAARVRGNGDTYRRSDYDLNPGLRALSNAQKSRPAAVLVPIIARAEGLHVILTQRSAHLPSHAGQIAFPGGKIDPTDATAVDAALREAEEEIGLLRSHARPIGALDLYQTATGFEICPIVGLVHADFTPVPEPGEVDTVFEVPLAFLMDESNHQRHSRVWRGSRRYFFAMPYAAHYIWGATAGILRNFYDRVYT